MPALVLRELADNAADADDTAGRRSASIEVLTIRGREYWLIADQGNGIATHDVCACSR
ncbi:MAG: hypothetical protein ACJ8AI_30315 [Rhodopila sp.]